MAGQAQDIRDAERRAGVDLDQTAALALVSQRRGPGLAEDELCFETFLGRQGEVLARVLPMGGDRRFQRVGDLQTRDGELGLVLIETFIEIALTWQQPVEFVQDGLIVLLVPGRCDGVV